MASAPSLLPVSESSSYTTSYDPSSPTSYNGSGRAFTPPRIRRAPSPRPQRLPVSPSLTPSPRRWIRQHLTPRIVFSLVLWSSALYLVHRFLLPLPVPTVTRHSNHAPKSQQHFLATTFPPPPSREGDDSLDSPNPLYRAYSPLPPPDDPFPRLRPTRFLPPRCMAQWFIDGETLCGAAELGEEEKLDATWLWVNGSDHRWRDTMVHWREKEGVYSPEHHFRENNELVHSMRSVLASLPGKTRTFHLLLADFPFSLPADLALLPDASIPELESSAHDPSEPRYISHDHNSSRSLQYSISKRLADRLASTWRVTQTPSWLHFGRRDPAEPSHPFHVTSTVDRGRPLNKIERDYPTLRYATHTEVFHLPTMERDAVTEELGERVWREKSWRQKALPSFNSMSIESRLGWLPGLADVMISLNDDFFLLKPHAVSDFHSPLYGSVIRFDHGYYQQVRPILDKTRYNDAGESGGLYHANYILSKRFPRRLRPYFAHVPKVITRGLHHEASLMFKEDLQMSSSRRFRELSTGEGDVQMLWLLTSLRVERWREALLWTFVVTNIGTLGEIGAWGDEARTELMDMFGLGPGDEDVVKIEVHRGERWTLELGRMGRTLEQAGWEAPKATDFLFSSMDGHLPPIPKPGVDPSNANRCVLDLARCFGGFWSRGENVTSADMFKRLAFAYPDCGDCMIMALVTGSGPLGLSAFFPPRGTTYTNLPLADGKQYPKYLPPPHLPLTATWHEADFSLENVMSTTALPGEKVDLCEYAMKLLSRYLYLSARSDSHFHMLKSPEHATRVFGMIDDNPNVSILGLNDDIEEDYDTVKVMMNEWFGKRWPKKAVWERNWDSERDRVLE